jgi:uncharacterized membrane protein YraQ (UPF0718 family)
VAEFFDLLRTALGAPTAKLFIVAGLVFLGVAIVGNITGRIQPGVIGRVLGGLIGPLLIVGGLGLELMSMRAAPVLAQPAVVSQVATPTSRPDPKSVAPTPRPAGKLATPTAKQIIDSLGR